MEQIASVVRSRPINCTHFDAFRHFTDSARPLNTISLTPEHRMKYEQGGCLHANSDLFKWALKMWPFSSSEVVADALEVAIAARVIDMRASPYDLSSIEVDQCGLDLDFDLTPIRVETSSGRAEYREETMKITQKAEPVRSHLIRVATEILDLR